MATRTLSISIDALVADNSGTSLGAGVDDHLPVGKGTGSTYSVRSLLKFNLDWTDVATITSAVLNLYRTSFHGAIVSPNYYVKRVTSTWSEGTRGSDEIWYGDNAVEWSNQPTTTSTNHVNKVGSVSGWNTITITDIVKQWAPTSIPGGGGQTNFGIMLRQTAANGTAVDEATGNYAEFESRHHTGGHDPYILLTYTTNTAPDAPTLNDPTAGEAVASQTPTLNFTPNDDQGDTHTAYTYDVDDNSDFSSPIEGPTEVTGSFPNAVAINRTVLATLVRGTTYYWRAKTKDASLYGAYAAGQSFKIGVLPTASVTIPANGHTAELWYDAGSDTTPKIKATWSFSDADGHSQTHSRVFIYADAAGSPGANVYDSGWVANTTGSFKTTYAATNGTFYHVSVQVRCSLTLESTESAKNRTRVRWGRASYYFDSGSTPLTLSVSNSQTVGANQALVLEYSVSASAVEPTDWKATISEAGLNRFFWHRATIWGWGSATPTSPSLNSLTWTYSATGLALDNWTAASGSAVDTGTYVYGTQSLRHDCNGADQRTYQVISVQPNRSLILQGRIKALGNPGAKIRIMSSDGSTLKAETTAVTATQDFTRDVTASIDTGSDTQLRIECFTNGAAGNTAWFDALKPEESSVATAWTPGFVGGSVTVDAGGLGVDGLKGGVFRLRGSDAGGQATIELGPTGFKFESDVGTDDVMQAQVVGDTVKRLAIEAGGSIRWGSGSATVDTILERKGADLLGTDDAFRLGLVSLGSAPATEGAAKWDDTFRTLFIGDSNARRAVTPLGFQPMALPFGLDFSTPNSSTVTLAAVSGGLGEAVQFPVFLTAPMLFDSLWVYTTDTATARTGEWRLFYERLGTSSTVFEIPDANGTFSYTPTVATWRSSAAVTPPVELPPGIYWVVLRNTSTTQTWGVGVTAGALTGAPIWMRRKSIAALGTSLDMSGWTNSNNRLLQVALAGRVFNEAAKWPA